MIVTSEVGMATGDFGPTEGYEGCQWHSVPSSTLLHPYNHYQSRGEWDAGGSHLNKRQSPCHFPSGPWFSGTEPIAWWRGYVVPSPQSWGYEKEHHSLPPAWKAPGLPVYPISRALCWIGWGCHWDWFSAQPSLFPSFPPENSEGDTLLLAHLC